MYSFTCSLYLSYFTVCVLFPQWSHQKMDEDTLQDWMDEELSELDDSDKDSDYEDNSDDSSAQSGSASDEDDSSDGEIQMDIDNDNGQANILNNDNDVL